jgi:N-methylhydantoinase A
MGLSVAIDIGGTFTDCLVSDSDGGMSLFKTPSTPNAFETGFVNVLQSAAQNRGQSLEQFLGDVGIIVHGTTVSTNALVEDKTARTGLIVNQGFPDTLTLREGPRKRSFAWRKHYPEPYISRLLTTEVRGRIDARGRELEPLEEDDVRLAAARLRRLDVEAVAVALLWSVANGRHECRIAEILEEELPGLPVTLSHQINPIPREYRRTIAAAIDASLAPVVRGYVQRLDHALRSYGYRNELLIANCAGGMMPPEQLVRRPIYSVMSGPTLAPIAALSLTRDDDVVVIDMGGTTFDVSAIRGGHLVVTPEAMIGNDLLGIPKVDVRSVGAGGGSIAWVDDGGLLRVGPRSAGAAPGPASYGAGGVEATVTDANVVLGIIDPDYFLGGRIRLSRSAADAAIDRIAGALGISRIAAAYAIHTTSNHNMVAAIEDITTNEGIDPRESLIVSGGGATACHIAEMATIIGLKRLLVPKVSAALSAYGGLVSDIRFDHIETLQTSARVFDLDGVNATLSRLHAKGVASLRQAEVAEDRWAFEYVFAGRYEYQSWEIDVPFTVDGHSLSQDDVEGLLDAFHSMHERIYTISDTTDIVEFTTWKVTAIGRNVWAKEPLRLAPSGLSAKDSLKGSRPVYLHAQGGLVDVPVFAGDALVEGDRIAGPCVIEEETTTLLLLSSMTAEIDSYGNYHVAIGDGTVGGGQAPRAR